MKNQPRIFVFADRCLGCHSCELACAVAHARNKTLTAAVYEEPKPQRRIFVEAKEGNKAPIHCRHCEEAPCVQACPTGALYSDPANQLIQYRREKCIGCLLCAMACPFGVIRPEQEHRYIVKCDYCPDRERPACVSACPSRALMFQTEADYERRRCQEISRLWWNPSSEDRVQKP